ncbi:MAG: hypothetical protein UR93_C0029G0011 [Berkelbacteria bacterium GW2011_GWA2_35_9]|uniref:DUF86 domain-containing protein n=1 Tax=Berkelbacteria bacterium GW2011_GWA2_35_9 TaxID=1618333 RepID=A0A0G0FK80_9BACT|nr:MAG: hypothetical protein UR93_C0029G0011 [Berkelbacteria bacterium GW2011_GWA2_35_9]
MDRDRLHLLHIRDAIEKIEKYSSRVSFENFAKIGLDYDAILMQIVVIGEAVNELSDEFREKHYNLPWHKPVAMRNKIAHGYFGIEPKIIWQTIKDDLPILKKEIEKLIK